MTMLQLGANPKVMFGIYGSNEGTGGPANPQGWNGRPPGRNPDKLAKAAAEPQPRQREWYERDTGTTSNSGSDPIVETPKGHKTVISGQAGKVYNWYSDREGQLDVSYTRHRILHNPGQGTLITRVAFITH